MTQEKFQKHLRAYISGEWFNEKMLLYPSVKDFLAFEELRGNLVVLKTEDAKVCEKMYIRLRENALVEYVIYIQKGKNKK